MEAEYLGCPGHHIGARHCAFRLHSRVGNYRISTVGDYYDHENKRREVGLHRYFETYVFKLRPEAVDPESDGCGCGVVEDWGEIDALPAQTAGEATKNHRAMVEKYKLEPVVEGEVSE